MDLRTRSRSRSLELVAVAIGTFAVLCVALFALYKIQGHDEQRWWKGAVLRHERPSNHAPWLIATLSPANGFGRRHVLRNTWQRLYANSSRFDTRFVISRADPLLRPLVQAENDTYGDIIELSYLNETSEIANSIKPIEFLKTLVGGSILRPYKLVSKLDDDAFIDATSIYDEHLQPLLGPGPDTNGSVEIPPTLLALRMYGIILGDWEYPQGGFYTMTWDLAVGAVREYVQNGTQGIPAEDVLMGKLLKDTGIPFHFDKMNYTEAHDFGGGSINKEQPWEGNTDLLWYHHHGVSPFSRRVHEMKEDDVYLAVADCFDENGVKVDEWKKHVNLKKWNKTISLTKGPKAGSVPPL